MVDNNGSAGGLLKHFYVFIALIVVHIIIKKMGPCETKYSMY
jgi:hypothetical protein